MLTPELRKQLIEDIVKSYAIKFPDSMRDAYKTTKLTRGTRLNKFSTDGSKDDMDMRLMFRIPSKLWDLFSMLVKDPAIFTDQEEFHWFCKTFPQFLVPEKW